MKLCGKAMAAALLGAALLGCGGGESVEVPKDAIVRLSDAFSSDFELVGVDGQTVRDESFRGKTMVVYFGFATCPDVCPLALSRLSLALNELTTSERDRLAPVFITVDPERDTPEKLKTYLAFDQRLIGLTGSRAAIDKARSSFKVYAKKAPLAGSALDYTVDHSSLFYLVNPLGKVTLALHDSLSAEELAEMLRRSIKRAN